jgi:hypothetical protein
MRALASGWLMGNPSPRGREGFSAKHLFPAPLLGAAQPPTSGGVTVVLHALRPGRQARAALSHARQVPVAMTRQKTDTGANSASPFNGHSSVGGLHHERFCAR